MQKSKNINMFFSHTAQSFHNKCALLSWKTATVLNTVCTQELGLDRFHDCSYTFQGWYGLFAPESLEIPNTHNSTKVLLRQF